MSGQVIAMAIASAVFAVASLVLFFLLQRKNADHRAETAAVTERIAAREQEIQALSAQAETLRQQLQQQQQAYASSREEISQLKTNLEQERRQSGEKLQLLQQAREQMTLEFKQLAGEILEDKSKRFTESNSENLSRILSPLNERIASFEKKVQDVYTTEAKERHSLANEVKNLQELNLRISQDAVNLTRALKGENKTQGTWGEVILESILEKSGLAKGREYRTQFSLSGEDGSRNQPDVIVDLPDNKQVVIDAKVSLKAYESYCSEEDEEKRAEYLRQHVLSIRGHVKNLSSKNYQSLMGLNSLDFVLLFMPVEASFAVAAHEDAALFSEAFDKNIILVGPSTLLATLRAIQSIWRNEQQSQNAIEIARSAGSLYDKFVAFVEDLEDVGKKLETTQKSYDKAHNKLSSGRGNLVKRTEKLLELGVKASKKQAQHILDKADLRGIEEKGIEDKSTETDQDQPDEQGPES